MDPNTMNVRRVTQASDELLRALAQVLVDCVAGGASVGFMHPLAPDKALAFWQRIAAGVASGERALLVAEKAGQVVGTVQLILAQPENQPHRADLSKMLVRQDARRQGIGAALLRQAEDLARASGKSLLVLDTASGDAERLYARLGWQPCGLIPGYALWPGGGLCATRLFYRQFPT